MPHSGMARHLDSCPTRAERLAETAGGAQSVPKTFLHLQVEDAYSGDYWLQLEMAGSTTLEALDRYLRAIWLECCGHMSKFSVGDAWRGRDIGMTRRVERAFDSAEELIHVYDFGTSSVTRIRRVGERRGSAATNRPVVMMARNDAPAFECMECHASAALLCLECVYDDRSGMLCAEHGVGHPRDDDELMPVVNSPRMGLCGYTGPARPPY